eukprot:370343_1
MYCIGWRMQNKKQTAADWMKGAESAQEQVKNTAGKNDIRICKEYKNKEIFDGDSFWGKSEVSKSMVNEIHFPDWVKHKGSGRPAMHANIDTLQVSKSVSKLALQYKAIDDT